LSGTVHVKISELEQYVISDEKEVLRRFKYGPDDTGIVIVISTAIDYLLLAGRITLSFFKVDKTRQFDDLLSKLMQLIQNSASSG